MSLTRTVFLLAALCVSSSAVCVDQAVARDGAIPERFVEQLLTEQLTGRDKALADVIANTKLNDVALNRARYIAHNDIINHRIKSSGITNQKGSGRCWIFAGFNVLRPEMIRKHNLKEFEFSETYIHFWDKLEKANLFLQSMIDLADSPLDDRRLAIVLDTPLGDGGWWTYFTDLVRKYGVVPKEQMPETHNSSSTGIMNKILTMKIMEMGLALRSQAREGASDGDLDKRAREYLTEVYRLLVIHLGRPPTEFTWRYEVDDSVSSVTHPTRFTPQSFLDEVVDIDLDAYVALFNYPGKEFAKTYALELSRNMYDRPDFTILNMPIDTLRAYAHRSVLDSTAVWFACDVGQENYRAEGIMALDIYNYESLYGTSFDMPKADLIHMELISPSHAMAFVGVDTAGTCVEKWLVENSWGDDNGDDGMWYMYNDWFDRYMFGVIIHKRYLSDHILELWEQDPIRLPPWDPMYALNKLD